MIDFRKALLCTITDYIRWITSTKMMIAAILAVFVYSFVVNPLIRASAEMGEPLNLFEPYIAVLNSGAIMLIVPVAFLALISDFPKTDGISIFYISRTGRLNWLVGQIVLLAVKALTVMFVIFLICVVPNVPFSFVHSEWSNVATDFRERFPERAASFTAELLPENLYNQLDVFSAALTSSLLTMWYLLILGLIMLTFAMLKRKTVGYIVSGTVIAAGSALCTVRSDVMWAFPMANTTVWLHFTKYYREPVVPIWFSVCYLAAITAVLLYVCFVKIRTYTITE